MTPKDLLGGLPIFYIEFEYNSIEYRIAQNAFDSADDTSTQYIDGLLSFDFVEAANIGGDVENNIVTCQVALPNINVIEMANKGMGMDGVACEFGYYIWRNGEIVQKYDQRIVLYRGEIVTPQFGDPDEPDNFVSFSIEAQPWANNQLMLQLPVIDQRFPNRHIETADGKPWPLVFGQPGFVKNNQYEKTNYATPAYCIKEYDSHSAQFMIAGHDIAGTGNVTIIDENGQTATKAILSAVDDYGNRYQYISILPSDNVAMPGYSGSGDSREWWIYWNTSAYPNRFGAGSLTRAGDLLQWALLRSGQRIDIGAFSNMASLLNRYSFSGFVNDPAMYAWEWVQGNILPLLPVGIRMGPNGLRPVLDQFAYLDFLNPIDDWYVGRDMEIQQISAVTMVTAPDDIVNDVTLKYGYNGYGNNLTNYTRCRHIREQQNELKTDIAKISVNRYGVKQMVIESNYVHDGITADLIVRTIVQSNALPRYEVQLLANVQWGYLQIGDIISVTATRLGLDKQNAMIVGKKWNTAYWQFTIQYQLNPNLA